MRSHHGVRSRDDVRGLELGLGLVDQYALEYASRAQRGMELEPAATFIYVLEFHDETLSWIDEIRIFITLTGTATGRSTCTGTGRSTGT